MTSGQMGGVLHHLRKLSAEHAGGRSDRDLLERFVRQRDEAAFAALVERHGPMVLGVCRRVLRDAHDAEDACQAVFLVLARKAGSIRHRESVGGWLHGVAYRVAANLKREIARRHAREVLAVAEPQADSTEMAWHEMRAVLDEELHRLPDRFRAPLLLCYLEGKTRDEAAQELGWSSGTLRGRLERGRELLRERLTRRGLALPVALLAALLTGRAVSAALPPALAGRIVRAGVLTAAGRSPAALVSGQAAALAKGAIRAMCMTRLKIAAVVLVVGGLLGLRMIAWLLSESVAVAQAPARTKPAFVPMPPPMEATPDASDREQSGDPASLARDEAQSQNNLKEILLAMHNYQDMMGHFPAPAIYEGEKDPWASSAFGPASGGGSPAGPAAAPGGAPAAGPPGAAVPTPAGVPGMMPSGGSGGRRPPNAGGKSGPGMMGASGGAMAGAAPVGKGGKALLSWRVTLLPLLNQDALYRQFHLNEPWDSPHNIKLLAQMPQVYAPPGGRAREPDATFYQVFVGPHAAFEKHRALGMADFTDGTSNTLMVVEAGSPVPWTKPEDLHFDPDEPLPELGGLFPGIFNAALADGSVHAFSKNADPNLLRAAITRDQGEVVDLNRLMAPRSQRRSELRQQNERLKQELDKQRQSLEELRREKQQLQEEDPESQQLKKDNARLEYLLRQTRDEVERLREEVRRLKQGRGPGEEP
jgi:RNA polymerase sigma factor (sigma-70 family)